MYHEINEIMNEWMNEWTFDPLITTSNKFNSSTLTDDLDNRKARHNCDKRSDQLSKRRILVDNLDMNTCA